MTIVVVDADHITFRSASSCSPTKAKQFQEEEHIALERARTTIDHLAYVYNNPTMEFYIAGEDNWRKTYYPEYKANRAKTEPPLHLNAVRELLVTEYKATVVNGMEVDDMCGIRMTQLWNNPEKVVCVSLDKDLLQVPGYHYAWEIGGTTSTGTKWNKPAQELYITPLDGIRRFYKQLILGDQSDYIPGFDGKYRSSVPKFIQELMAPIDELNTEALMYSYVKGLYETDAIDRNATLLWVMREHDKRWEPPSG